MGDLPKLGWDYAIKELTSLLSELNAVVELTASDLKFYDDKFTKGWSIPKLFKDDSISLRILITKSFPYLPPRIGIWPKREILSWPHLEEYGLLCLLSNEHSISPERPGEVVVALLTEAVKLVNQCLSDPDSTAFQDEFISYWGKGAVHKRQFIAISAPTPPSRFLFALDHKNITVFSDETDGLIRWVGNVFGKDPQPRVPYKLPFFWLDKFPIPSQYPSSVSTLRELVKMDALALSILDSFASAKTYFNLPMILIGSNNEYGRAFGGLIITHPRKLKGPAKTSNKKNRRKSIPVKPVVITQIDRVTVTRSDPEWVHGRDHNPAISLLKTAHVIILGVGSVGSGVAELLIKSGVGKLTLVDPELLAPENVYRHEMGIANIWGKDGNCQNKATALAQVLNQRFPHARIVGIPSGWQEMESDVLSQANLIVSTIGVWSQEAELNESLQHQKTPPPIIYGWTEAHAVAGHAVLIMPGEGCLRCVVTEMGKPKITTAEIPVEKILSPIPACGGHFQPYGAVELSYIQGIISELCISTLTKHVDKSTINSWIGSRSILQSIDGSWNPDWVKINGDPGEGGITHISIFSRDPYCPCCGEKP